MEPPAFASAVIATGSARHSAPARPRPPARPPGPMHFRGGVPRADKVLSVMGEGTFGKVVEVGRRVRAQCGPIDAYMGARGVQAWDREKRKYLAVKIIRNVPKCGRFSRPLFGLGGFKRTVL
jgi:hypothetical protein